MVFMPCVGLSGMAVCGFSSSVGPLQPAPVLGAQASISSTLLNRCSYLLPSQHKWVFVGFCGFFQWDSACWPCGLRVLLEHITFGYTWLCREEVLTTILFWGFWSLSCTCSLSATSLCLAFLCCLCSSNGCLEIHWSATTSAASPLHFPINYQTPAEICWLPSDFNTKTGTK